MDQVDQPSPPGDTTALAPPTPWFQRWQLWTGIGAVIAVVVAAGFLGAAAVDPTASEQYQQVSAELADTQQDRDRVQDNYEAVQGQVSGAQSSAAAAVASAAQVSSAASARQSEMDAREAELAAREAAVGAAEEQIAANTIGPGTYVVGVDMQPGTYRTENAVSSDCYWAILVSGTNGDDIVENDLPGGGFPTVTVSEGQDFKSNRCGNWILQ